jgi:predicted transcriptional regulator
VTTIASPEMLKLAEEIEDAVPTAVFSGIVGDAAHKTRPSKHNSIEDNPKGSWPIIHKKDAAPPGNWSRKYAAAIDISLPRKDQNRIHESHRRVFRDKTDPRREYLYAFNGWDGHDSPGRYNLVTGTISTTDDSHKWHEHTETFYRYANDPKMREAIASIYANKTKEQYLASTKGFLMALSDKQQQEIYNYVTQPLTQRDHAHAMWRIEALANFRETHINGPEKGRPVALVRAIKALAAAISQLDNKVGNELAKKLDEIEKAAQLDQAEVDALAEAFHAKLSETSVADLVSLLRSVLSEETITQLKAAL